MLIFIIASSIAILSFLLLVYFERCTLATIPSYIFGPLCCLSLLITLWTAGLAMVYNCNTTARHLTYNAERTAINSTLRELEKSPENIFSSEATLLLYNETLNRAKELNENIHIVTLKQADIWVGWYQDKAYLNIEPIKYSEVTL